MTKEYRYKTNDFIKIKEEYLMYKQRILIVAKNKIK
jgi:hypothetical protein